MECPGADVVAGGDINTVIPDPGPGAEHGSVGCVGLEEI